MDVVRWPMIARGRVDYLPLGDAEELEAKVAYLPQIQKYARVPVTEDDVHLFAARIINTKVAAFGGRFTPESAQQLAALVPGRPVMFEHNYDTPPIGKFFAAKRIFIDDPQDSKDENYWVEALAYVPKDPEGDAIMTRIKLGIYEETSAAWAFLGLECSVCGQDMRACGHWPGEVYDPGGLAHFDMHDVIAFYEGSIVFAGAEHGTHMVPLSASVTERGFEAEFRYSAGQQPDAFTPPFRAWASALTQEYGQTQTVEQWLASGRQEIPTRTGTVSGLLSGAAAQEREGAEGLRTAVQSVLCPTARFTPEQAKAWCQRHGFKSSKVDTPETGDYHRLRQFDPSECADGTERTITLEKKRKADAIKAVICRKNTSGEACRVGSLLSGIFSSAG